MFNDYPSGHLQGTDFPTAVYIDSNDQSPLLDRCGFNHSLLICYQLISSIPKLFLKRLCKLLSSILQNANINSSVLVTFHWSEPLQTKLHNCTHQLYLVQHIRRSYTPIVPLHQSQLSQAIFNDNNPTSL